MDGGERKQRQRAGSYRDLGTLGRVLAKLIAYAPAGMLLLSSHSQEREPSWLSPARQASLSQVLFPSVRGWRGALAGRAVRGIP